MNNYPREFVRYQFSLWLRASEFCGRPIRRLSDRVVWMRILIAAWAKE